MTATLHKVVAGNGYLYYLRKVAANDTSSRGRASLADYYSVHGEAPGTWYGKGLAALDLSPGDEVTEAQMESLYGLGRHPNAKDIEARVIDEEIGKGAKLKDAIRAAEKKARLGAPFPTYSDSTAYRKRCAQAYELYNIAGGGEPDDDLPEHIRAQIRTEVATEMFTEQYDRAPLDSRELSSWVARNSRPKSTAIAGYDLTFSPVKSFSALWAVAPKAVAERMEAAHRAAVDVAIAWIEQHATYTRLGRGGIRQVDVEGLVASRWLHRESRAGDPDWHEHVFIANRVRTLDGLWRTLDSARFYEVAVTASEIYNTALELFGEDMVGLEFAERPGQDPSKRPIREIVGVSAELCEHWSKRDSAITARLGQLTVEFQRTFAREPTTGEVWDLAERATLETRPAKQHSRSRAQERADWRAEAVTVLGGRTVLANMVSAALNPLRRPRPIADEAWIARTAQAVVAIVSEQRSTWRAHHIWSETQRQLRGQIRLRDYHRVAEAVVAAALAPPQVLAREDPDLTAEPGLRTTPAAFARHDAQSVYVRAGSQVYTSAEVLATTQQLIDLAVAPGGRTIPADVLAEAVRAYNQANPGEQLNAGQIAVVQGFANSPMRIATVEAPAGTGKTTAMRVLAQACAASGGTVLGLAPTASAAAQLSAATGVRVETVDKLLHVLERHTPSIENLAGQGDRPPPHLPQWVLQIDHTTMVIVDEHVKIGDRKRLRLLQFLTARDATIRCLGDPRQLSSIEAGGAHADMSEASGEAVLSLSHVVRFASHGEASASLMLREGDPAALGYYLDHGRIHSGSAATVHDDAYTRWIADYLGGRDTIMLARIHTIVDELNRRARADRLARAGAPTGPQTVLADDLYASVGDTIVTRHNNPRLQLPDGDWVRNGYRWIVTAVGADGSLQVTHLRAGRELGQSVSLPGDYVRTQVRLGYATTIDSAQGVTADTCHVALTGAETLPQLYVAMTRGIYANHLYVPTALEAAEGAYYTEPAVFPRTAVEILLRILGREGRQQSAHTEHRDALDPVRRIGRALDIYLDTLGLAAENALGTGTLTRLDQAAEAIYPGLSDCPAYPVLRQHLAILALRGRDPFTALGVAAAERELDSAVDAAAVLDWRLDSTGSHSARGGPLPWAHGLPAGLDTAADLAPLRARARIVAELAAQIRADAAQWSAAAAPYWARPLAGADPALLAELAVWRASLHLDDRDLRPTGPPRHTVLERSHQRRLDDRVRNAVGDLTRPVNRWAPLARTLEPRLTADPYWPVLADKIDLADRAGIDITARLTEAAEMRPLPDDMPAAALWARLELDPSALDHHIDVRPDWTESLHEVLGAESAERVIADRGWARLVAVVDHGIAAGWDPRDLLATAHELLLSAQSNQGAALRPDQLTAALAWRVDALLRPQSPFTAAEYDIPTESEPTTMQKSDAPTAGEPEPDPPPEPPPDLSHRAPHRPDIGLDHSVAEIAALFQAGHIRAASLRFADLTAAATAEQRDIITRVAETLYRYAYPVARAHLRDAAHRFPEHRALIEACTPRADPQVYQPDTTSAEPGYQRRRRHEAARDNPNRTFTPTPRTEPAPEDEHTTPVVSEYVEHRHEVDDEPTERPMPAGFTHHYRNSAPDLERDLHCDAGGYSLDYDRTALAESRTLPCVSCGLERPEVDNPTRIRPRSDDGLCGECRAENMPGIPDHDPAEIIRARCDHIAAIHTPAETRALLQRDWRIGSPVTRARIKDWVTRNPFPEPDPVLDELGRLSDSELRQAIDDLAHRIAMSGTDEFLFAPYTEPVPDPAEERVRRQRQQDLVTQAIEAEAAYRSAERAHRSAESDLAGLRAELDDTPGRRRGQRRDLTTQIAEAQRNHAATICTRNEARSAARNACRDAELIAGPRQQWQQILDAQQQPLTPVPASGRASRAPDDPHSTRLTEFQRQLDELENERQRRTQLSPEQTDREHTMRQHVAEHRIEPADDVDTQVDIRDPDHDLGL
ncbi:MobF family relaxase [Nocardia sp. XZ_19_385]|uniref:MobF family relaxase n=1 Tax=Nocardia sp. XZ_19_385 TaxID=2769488 RepID=UPI00188E0B6B|nr:MobF family relaxase [Nocardia sp. XZ_19_385]